MLISTNCNNKVHSLKFSMVDSSLILDLALQEVARSCLGLKRRCTHCCMGIICAGEGVTHMRAVGVNEQAAGGTWIWAGARPVPAAGTGCLRWLVSTRQASASAPSLLALAPAPTADVRQRRAQASASTCPCCRRPTALLYKCTFCSLTVPTVCTIAVSVLAAFQPYFQAKRGISGQLHHYYLFFLIITIIITY